MMDTRGVGVIVAFIIDMLGMRRFALMATKTKNIPSMYDTLRKRLNEIISMDRHSVYFMPEASKLADKIAWARKWHKVTDAQGLELISDMIKVFEGEI